jgi:integrase
MTPKNYDLSDLAIILPNSPDKDKETGLQIRPMILKNKKNINKNGECKVYIEIVVFVGTGKITRRLPTDIYLLPKNWKKQRVTKGDPDYIKKNIQIEAELIKYKDKLFSREMTYWSIKEGGPAKPQRIEDMYPKPYKFLIHYIDDFIDMKRTNKTPIGTLKEFTTCKNRLLKYEEHEKTRLRFKDMNMTFSNNLYSFMNGLNYNQGTIKKTYSIIRTILNFYYELKDEMDLDLSDKFRSKTWIKGEKSINKPHPISKEEFDILLNHKFEQENLQKTSDRFILQCVTGLRYSDLFKINKKDNIKEDCIKIYPTKTVHKNDNLVIIPLNAISKRILEKYDYNTEILKISNQKYNTSLKALFKELNDEKYEFKIKFDNYTTHDGRDTFITYSLEAGVAVPYLLKMVGQSDYDVMKRYFDISIKYIKENAKKVEIFSKK